MSQGRYVDAVHLFQSAIRVLSGAASPVLPPCTSGLADVCAWLCFALFQCGHTLEAQRAISRSLLLNPSLLHNWCNLALLKEEHAMRALSKAEKTAKDIRGAMAMLADSRELMKGLRSAHSSYDYTTHVSRRAVGVSSRSSTDARRGVINADDLHSLRATVIPVDPNIFDDHIESCQVR